MDRTEFETLLDGVISAANTDYLNAREAFIKTMYPGVHTVSPRDGGKTFVILCDGERLYSEPMFKDAHAAKFRADALTAEYNAPPDEE